MQLQQQQQAKPKYRTLEEIEAEMAQQQQRMASPAMASRSAGPPPGLGQNRPMTVEEVEAEMMRKAQESRNQQHQQQQQPSQQQYGNVQALAAQAQQMAIRQQSYQQQQQMPQQQQMQQVQYQPSPQMQQQRAPLAPMVSPQAGPTGNGGDMLSQLFPGGPQQPSGPRVPSTGVSLDDRNALESLQARMVTNEASEASRRRKAAKIHRMAKYNNLMTQGDKDFITRIQVSQLINSAGPGGSHDPYADDFYFSVMQSLKQSRLAAQQQAMERQMKDMMGNAPGGAGGAGPVGQPPAQAGQMQQGPPSGNENNNRRRQGGRNNNQQDQRMTRRENAMNRMAQQVQRLVDDAKKKPRATQLSLDGALGKIAIRTRSAPRPLLQVDSKRSSTSAEELGAAAAVNSLSSSLNRGNPASANRAALDRRQVLIALERVYDLVLQLEQSRRAQPSLEASARAEAQACEAHGNPPDFPRGAREVLAAQAP